MARMEGQQIVAGNRFQARLVAFRRCSIRMSRVKSRKKSLGHHITRRRLRLLKTEQRALALTLQTGLWKRRRHQQTRKQVECRIEQLAIRQTLEVGTGHVSVVARAKLGA